MSFQAMAWASKQKCGGTVGKAVLLFLANYADENNQCWPSVKRLAEDCETTERTVYRWIKELEKRGLLSHTTRSIDGMQTSNLYTLAIPGVTQRQGGVTQCHPPMTPCQEGGDTVTDKPIKEPINTLSEEKGKPNVKGPRQITADWQPDTKLRQWAEQERPELNISKVVETFRDYWLGNGSTKKDWNATFRNWVRREKLSPTNGTAGRTGTSGPVTTEDRRSRLADAANNYMATKQGQAN